MDAQGHALEMAEQAAEALRELNHRTRDPRAFTGPAELALLVGLLAETEGRPRRRSIPR